LGHLDDLSLDVMHQLRADYRIRILNCMHGPQQRATAVGIYDDIAM
jgi:hypothetical protein